MPSANMTQEMEEPKSEGRMRLTRPPAPFDVEQTSQVVAGLQNAAGIGEAADYCLLSHRQEHTFIFIEIDMPQAAQRVKREPTRRIQPQLVGLDT